MTDLQRQADDSANRPIRDLAKKEIYKCEGNVHKAQCQCGKEVLCLAQPSPAPERCKYIDGCKCVEAKIIEIVNETTGATLLTHLERNLRELVKIVREGK